MRAIKSGRTRQMRLPLAAARTWGGARKGAGRKPRGRPSMPHVTRRKIDPRYPVQVTVRATRSEAHTSELQSRPHLVCRLLLEKKTQTKTTISDRLASAVWNRRICRL